MVYNFIVYVFFILTGPSILFEIIYFKNYFWTFNPRLGRDMTKIKPVDIKEIYNFAVDNSFIWNNLSLQNLVWICRILKSEFSSNLILSNDRNQMYKSCRDVQLCWSQFFYWNHLSSYIKFSLELQHFECQIFWMISNGEMINTKVVVFNEI